MLFSPCGEPRVSRTHRYHGNRYRLVCRASARAHPPARGPRPGKERDLHRPRLANREAGQSKGVEQTRDEKRADHAPQWNLKRLVGR
jgi:DNA-directed RNA polymerase subunit K/omega